MNRSERGFSFLTPVHLSLNMQVSEPQEVSKYLLCNSSPGGHFPWRWPQEKIQSP